MTEIIVDTNQDNGREFRTVTASTKVTDQELAQLESAAAARGVRLGEWIREVLFREARLSADPPHADPEMVEIMGLQMFLTRILTTIACGDRMQFQPLILFGSAGGNTRRRASNWSGNERPINMREQTEKRSKRWSTAPDGMPRFRRRSLYPSLRWSVVMTGCGMLIAKAFASCWSSSSTTHRRGSEAITRRRQLRSSSPQSLSMTPPVPSTDTLRRSFILTQSSST